MLLFNASRVALYTPPKTASTTLIEVLTRAPYHGTLCIGPVGNEGHYDHHSSVTPPIAHSWRKVAVVRHPLQRLVSLWGFFAKNELLAGRGVVPFDIFALQVAQNQHPFYFYQWNQSQVLGPQDYELVKVESLGEDLCRLGLLTRPDELPRANYFSAENASPSWESLCSRPLLEALRHWWEPDAQRFSYIVPLPPFPALVPTSATSRPAAVPAASAT